MVKNINITKLIDHTLLKPDATIEEIKQLCKQAKEFNFAAVCVNSYYISLCKNELTDSDVKICSPIGFPIGAEATDIKVYEIKPGISNILCIIIYKYNSFLPFLF